VQAAGGKTSTGGGGRQKSTGPAAQGKALSQLGRVVAQASRTLGADVPAVRALAQAVNSEHDGRRELLPLQERVQAIEAEVVRNDKRLESLSTEREECEAKLAGLQTAIVDAEARAQELQDKLASANSEMAEEETGPGAEEGAERPRATLPPSRSSSRSSRSSRSGRSAALEATVASLSSQVSQQMQQVEMLCQALVVRGVMEPAVLPTEVGTENSLDVEIGGGEAEEPREQESAGLEANAWGPNFAASVAARAPALPVEAEPAARAPWATPAEAVASATVRPARKDKGQKVIVATPKSTPKKDGAAAAASGGF